MSSKINTVGVTDKFSYIELGNITDESSKKDLIGIITKCGPNCLTYGIITDGVNVGLCVVANLKPKNVLGMTVHEVDGLFYCCADGGYTTKPACNFSSGSNYSYLIGVNGNIVYGLVPERVEVKTISYSTVATPVSTPKVVLPAPKKLSKKLKDDLAEFEKRESKYFTLDIEANNKKMHITFPTPYATSGKRCKRDKCESISCTDHDINEYMDTLVRIKDNWKSYKKNNFNYQLGGAAKVLYDAYVDFLNDDYVDWGEVMRHAVMSVVMEGEAFTVVQ